MRKQFFAFFAVLLLLLVGCDDKIGNNNNNNEEENSETSNFKKDIAELLSRSGKLECEEYNFDKVVECGDTVDMGNDKFEVPGDDNVYENGAYSVTTTESYSITENPHEFVTLDPWASLYPGALVQGSSLAKGGMPATVPAGAESRLPGKIYLSIVSGDPDKDYFEKECPMSASSVTATMNDLLEELSGHPARTSFEMSIVQSTEQMALSLGINLKLYGQKINSSFGTSFNETKNYVAVKLNQTFFTMGYDDPSFGRVFTDDVTADDLAPYTGVGNPICYVSSVSYGRVFILLYETSESAEVLRSALAATFSNGSSTYNDFEMKNTITNSSVKILQIGGDPVAGLETMMGDMDKIRQFVVGGAKVTPTNVGAPISYKINHLYDNTNVTLSNTLEYTVKNKTFLPKKPEGDIIFDIENVDVVTNAHGKRHVSNYSNIKTGKIEVTVYDAHPEGIFKPETKFIKTNPFPENNKGEGVGTIIGATRSLYEHVGFGNTINYKIPRIRVEMPYTIYNESYRNGTKKASINGVAIMEFEKQDDGGEWVVVGNEENNDLTHPHDFNKYTYTFSGGEMDTQLTINFRLKIDGLVYPINHK